VALAGRSRVEFGQGGFRARPEDDELFTLLERWGVTVGRGQVLDARSATLAVPVTRREVVQFEYPYWPDVRPDAMDAAHLAIQRIPT
jgi:ABC-type uncharacterized transport system involved in gliding motility auxiliary subunit